MGDELEAYFNSRPQHLRSLMLEIRQVLVSLHPLLEECVKHKIPFYTHKGKSVCYLSTKENRLYVQVGFVKGFKLSDPYHSLVEDNRTIVRSLNFE
jgi:hypothetical protein